jgi:hypothetical protein
LGRISLIEREVLDAQSQTVYDHLTHARGKVPRLFKTMAHCPEIMRTASEHLRAVLESGTVPLKLKLLMIVRTSQLNRCEY